MSVIILGRAQSHHRILLQASADPDFIKRYASTTGLPPKAARSILVGRLSPTDEQQRILYQMLGLPLVTEPDPDPDLWPSPDYENLPDEAPDYD